MIGEGVVAKVTALIGSENLEFYFIKSRRRGCPNLEEARFAGIIQIEFL
jgi:hypothetical protein